MNRGLNSLALVLLAVALVASGARADFPASRAGADRELRPGAGTDSGMPRGTEGATLTGAPEVAPSLTAIQQSAPAESSWPTRVESALRSHELGLRPLNGQLSIWYQAVVSGSGSRGMGVAAENTSVVFGKPDSETIESYDQYRTPVPAPGAVLLGALGLGLIGGIRTNKKRRSD